MKPGRQPLTPPSWKCFPSPQDPMWRRCNLILFPCVFVFFFSFFFFIQLFILVLTFHTQAALQLPMVVVRAGHPASPSLLWIPIMLYCLFYLPFSSLIFFASCFLWRRPAFHPDMTPRAKCVLYTETFYLIRMCGEPSGWFILLQMYTNTNQNFPLRLYSRQLILLSCLYNKDQRLS